MKYFVEKEGDFVIPFDASRWKAVQESYDAWWKGTSSRPLAGAAVRREDAPQLPPPITQANCTDWSKSPRELVCAIEDYLSTFDYWGDAYPVYSMDCFGPGVAAAMLGAEADNKTGRVWFLPRERKAISDLHFEFDPHNPWFLRLRDIYLTAAERFQGKALLSMADLGGILDILSTFRPGELLLYDLIDEPEQVKRLTEEAEEAWRRIYWEFYKAQNAAEYGCTDWSTIYSRDPSYVLQCDFCYMIGTDMFEEFVLHTLQRDCAALANTLYHLDGEGELRHLERLLAIPELKAVQWVPGAGKPECDAYPEIYKKIIAAGKLAQVNSGSLEVFERVVEESERPGAFHRQLLFAEADRKEEIVSSFRRLHVFRGGTS